MASGKNSCSPHLEVAFRPWVSGDLHKQKREKIRPWHATRTSMTSATVTVFEPACTLAFFAWSTFRTIRYQKDAEPLLQGSIRNINVHQCSRKTLLESKPQAINYLLYLNHQSFWLVNCLQQIILFSSFYLHRFPISTLRRMNVSFWKEFKRVLKCVLEQDTKL